MQRALWGNGEKMQYVIFRELALLDHQPELRNVPSISGRMITKSNGRLQKRCSECFKNVNLPLLVLFFKMPFLH
jgi:hypothetical protein